MRLLVGGKALATEVGLEYESRVGALGLSTFAMFSKKRDTTNAWASNPEQWVLGMGVPVYITNATDFDAYITPGAAVIYQKQVPADNKDVYTFGPSLKIGAQWAFMSKWSAGVEFTTLSNWFSDKIASSQTSANATLGYRF